MKIVSIFSLIIITLTGVAALTTTVGALVREADTVNTVASHVSSPAIPIVDQEAGLADTTDDGTAINPSPTEDAQVNPIATTYANHYGITLGEAVDHLNLQESFSEVGAKLDTELSTQEAETYGGLWLEHGPVFKIVVAFIRDGEEILKKYYFEELKPFLPFLEVRTVKISQQELEKTKEQISSILRTMNFRFFSVGADLTKNCVDIKLVESNRMEVEEAIQSGKLMITDYVHLKFIADDDMPVLQ